MTPERRIELLDLVSELAGELKGLEIPYQNGSPSNVTGLPKVCLGQVIARLEAGDSLKEVKSFVGQLAKLDRMVAQNSKNPQAPYRALQEVLEAWFDEQPALTSPEWLYLLGWVHRRLPIKSEEGRGNAKQKPRGSGSKTARSKGGTSSKENTTIRQVEPVGTLGNPMKARLAALKERMERGQHGRREK